jgi:hypothetical protein
MAEITLREVWNFAACISLEDGNTTGEVLFRRVGISRVKRGAALEVESAGIGSGNPRLTSPQFRLGKSHVRDKSDTTCQKY